MHIGTEKTGTTSIQSFLYQNRRALHAHGFHFLQCAGETNNRALPTYCMSDNRDDDFYRLLGITTLQGRIDYKSKFIREFEKELSKLPSTTRAVIISSEHFHSRIRTDEEVGNVHKLLSTYFSEFEIVCYLRDQITTCTSSYSTALKSGNPSTFDEFIKRCAPNSYFYNYWEMLQNWERWFGFDALNVSLFSSDRFLNGSLLDDFTAKIDPELVGVLNTNIQNENVSLKPSGQALARAVNLAFPFRSVRPELQQLRVECQQHIAERHTGRGRQLSTDAQREVFRPFATINESIRQRYFPGEEEILEPPAVSENRRSIVVPDLLNGFKELLGIIRTNGRGVVHKDEYAGIYNILFSCINELLYQHGEMKLISTLSREEVVFLRDLALEVEPLKVPAAILLLRSLDALDPASAGIGSAVGASG